MCNVNRRLTVFRFAAGAEVLDQAEALGMVKVTRPTDLVVEKVKAGK